MFLDDLLHNAQAQPGAIDTRGKEWIKDVWEIISGNAPPSIVNGEDDERRRRFSSLYARAHVHLAALLRRVDTVQQQVYERLVQQLRVAFEGRQRAIHIRAEGDPVLRCIGARQRHGPLDQLGDVDWPTLHRRWPRIGQQLLNQPVHSIDLALDHLGVLTQGRLIGQLALQHLRCCPHDAERVTNLMRQPAGEPPQRGKALGALDLLFERPQLGQIVEHEYRPNRLIMRADQRRAMQPELAVLDGHLAVAARTRGEIVADQLRQLCGAAIRAMEQRLGGTIDGCHVAVGVQRQHATVNAFQD